MRLNYIFPFLLLAAAVGLTGCFPVFLEPLANPPPRERPAVADNYEKYESITAGKKMIILDEQFTSNTRGWRQVTNSPDYTITVTGGEMFMRTIYSTQYNTISLPELKETDHFEIETLLKTTNGSGGYEGSSLVWGGRTSTPPSWYFFDVNDYNGSVEIGKATGVTLSKPGHYNRGAYNKLTIRKVKDTYYYFINGIFLGKEPFSAFYGPVIGFRAYFNTTLRVDYLTVSRLNL